MQIAKDAAKCVRLSCLSKLSRSYVIAYYDMYDDVITRWRAMRDFSPFIVIQIISGACACGILPATFLLSISLDLSHTNTCVYFIAYCALTCIFVQHLVEPVYILHYDRHRCRIILRSLDRNTEGSLSLSRGDCLLSSETRMSSYNVISEIQQTHNGF